jgi:SAM-dependent methyltransferase
MIRKKIFKWLEKRFYPHIYFFPNPFKIYEYRFMEKRGDLRPEHILLDIGCGHGVQTRLLARKVRRAVGIDISENAIGRARSNQALGRDADRSEFKATSIENARFPGSSFDRVFSVCVLEHIPDDESVLRECFRVLKPGGKLVFSVDSLSTIGNPLLRDLHAKKYSVCRYYQPDDIRNKLERAGFVNVRVTPLLRGNRARKWFEGGIVNDFAFRYSEAICKYWALRFFESLSRGDKGLYLIVEGYKPV